MFCYTISLDFAKWLEKDLLRSPADSAGPDQHFLSDRTIIYFPYIIAHISAICFVGGRVVSLLDRDPTVSSDRTVIGRNG